MISLRESSATPARTRMSSDSFKSSGPTAVDATGTPSEKSKGTKISKHSRSFSGKLDSAGAGEVSRAPSENGRSRASNDFEVNAGAYIFGERELKNFCAQDDDSLLQEFDELMRSGATMKVSLTPDRLKTMEVSFVQLLDHHI